MKTLYHFTDAHAAFRILKENKFHLSVAGGSESDTELNKGRLFYLSLTRTRSNAFANKMHGVMFELDGRALESRYKLEPVDYWGDPTYSESEERLVSDRPTIPATPFLVSVSINLERQFDPKAMRQLILACNRFKISVFAYNNIKDLISMQKSRRVPLNDPRIMGKGIGGSSYSPQRRDDLMPWLLLLHAVINKSVPQLLAKRDRDVDYIYDRVRKTYGNQMYIGELATQLRNDFARAQRFDKEERRSRTPISISLLAKQQGITVAGIPRFLYEATKHL